jgi:hypothetical protein
MGPSEKGFQPAPEVDVDASSQRGSGSRRRAKTTANEKPNASRRDRSGSLPSRFKELILSTTKEERQPPKHEEIQPYIARLKVVALEAEGLMLCDDPYIICTYDYSEAVMLKTPQGDKRIRTASASTWGSFCYL